LARSVEAVTDQRLLVWARETSGLTETQAATKISVPIEKLQKWEVGETRPTFAQLRKLAAVYGRPIAAFFLPEPPREPMDPPDRRSLPEIRSGGLGRRLHQEIRIARFRRESAIELFPEAGFEIPHFSLEIDATTDPEQSGFRIREYLGLTIDAQMNFRTDSEALRSWRSAAFSRGILVFQMSRVPITEGRGFSIYDLVFPVVVLNGADTAFGRLFTLLHEIAHLALRGSGLCDLETSDDIGGVDALEVLCNAIAASTLLPRHVMAIDPTVSAHTRGREWTDIELTQLSRTYMVSRECILRRLVTLDLATQREYRIKREVLLRQYSQSRQGEVHVPMYRRVISWVGDDFARLLLEGYDRRLVTVTDASELLAAKPKHFETIQAAVADA
jgi:Zn-dependent peptidase ImmA (M78 family)/transcriptional regulator with XRE-family HTH domain